MNHVILLYFGELVNKQFELVGMRLHVLTFEKPPSFNDLVARVRAVTNIGCDLWLHGRYDMGGNISTLLLQPVVAKMTSSCSERRRLVGG
jgi:hypothetical protein